MGNVTEYRSFVPVSRAHAIDARRIAVEFSDGRTGILDLSSLVGTGPWKRLADPAFFSQATAAFDTIVWPDDIDLAPEYVYDHTVLDAQDPLHSP